MQVNHRNLRQIDVIPQEKLIEAKVAIIGVGAIGRQVALMLATMGVGEIHLIDDDMVSTENLGCQGHFEFSVGQPKVNATEDVMMLANKGTLITTHQKRIKEFGDFDWDKAPTAIFCCVDNMDARKTIFDSWAGGNGAMFVDGRMSIMTCRCLSVIKDYEDDEEYYQSSLFPQSESAPMPCTAKATFFTANIIAGMMVASFVNRLIRGMPSLEKDITLNMMGWTISLDAENDAAPRIATFEEEVYGDERDEDEEDDGEEDDADRFLRENDEENDPELLAALFPDPQAITGLDSVPSIMTETIDAAHIEAHQARVAFTPSYAPEIFSPVRQDWRFGRQMMSSESPPSP